MSQRITIRIDKKQHADLITFSKELSRELGVDINVSDLVRESIHRILRNKHNIKAKLKEEITTT